MKIVLGLILAATASSSSASEYKVLGSSTCTDNSKVNNRGSIQVKVLSDVYESDKKNEQGLTLMVQSSKTRLTVEKIQTLTAGELNSSKIPVLLTLRAYGGNATYEANIEATPQKQDSVPSVRIISVSESSEFSDLDSQMPTNYNPTFICH